MADPVYLVPRDQLIRVRPYGDGWGFTCVTDRCWEVSHYVDYATAEAANTAASEHLASVHQLRPVSGRRRWFFRRRR